MYYQCKHPFSSILICATPGDGNPECDGNYINGIFISDDEKTVTDTTYWLITGVFFLVVVVVGLFLFIILLYLLKGKWVLKSVGRVSSHQESGYNVHFPIFKNDGRFTSRSVKK